jgi:hypothetical protein
MFALSFFLCYSYDILVYHLLLLHTPSIPNYNMFGFSRYVAFAMLYLEKPKRLIIWNEGLHILGV